MIFLVFTSILAATAAGLLVKYIFDNTDYPYQITWKEFKIGMIIISFIVAPAVTKIGWEMVRSNTVSFNEYWNGWELNAVRIDIPCTRDGSCYWCYDCDPYLVPVSYECGTAKNPQTCIRMETHYHSCPYVSNEFTYVVKTTLGEYRIDSHRFPVDPQNHRWRPRKTIPSSVINEAKVGAPEFWTAVYKRVNSGRPGPVTARRSYNNYVLASDTTILNQYSNEIEQFKSKDLLPAVNSAVHDFYLANKVYFVGYNPANKDDWQKSVAYLNAGLGKELEGDLHLVVVQNQSITKNPYVYANALRAYWLNKEAQSKDAFAKNGIGVVIGTADGKTVSWAKAFTGMPIGNEALTVAIENRLKGVELTPEIVVGNLQGGFKTPTSVEVIHTNGVIESVLWGLMDRKTKFQRYSMNGKDDSTGLGGGYLYLWGEIEPKSNQKFWIWIVTFIATSIVWTVFVFVDENQRKRTSAFRGQHWRR